MSSERIYTKFEIENALFALGEKAVAKGLILEISVYGGAAIMLAYDGRPATRDVDAVFEQSKDAIRTLASEVASDFGLTEDWLNDGVKGFLSHLDNSSRSKQFLRSYPSEDKPGLRVMVASPEYLFAMKCLAMRLGSGDRDRADIVMLAKLAGIESVEKALEVVSDFYPRNRIEAKTQFGLMEIFEEMEHRLSEGPKK